MSDSTGGARRWLVRLLKGFGLLLAVLGVATIVASLAIRHREASRWPPLSEVPPIEMPPPHIPPDDEARALVVQIGEVQNQAVDWREVMKPVGPPRADDLDLWRQDTEAQQLMEQLLARPGMSVPFPDAFLDDWPNLVPHQALTRSVCLRGWDRALAGDPDAAVRDMLQAMQLGQRFLDCNNALLPAMVGVAIEGLALRELAELMDTTVTDRPDLLVAAANELLVLSESPPGLPRALAWECAGQEEVFRADLATLLEQAGGGSADTSFTERLIYTWGYDADTTIAWHRPRCQFQVDQAAKPWLQRRESIFEFDILWPRLHRPSAGQLLHNPAGRIVLMFMPDYASLVEREDRLRAIQRGHALAWAARAWMLEHDGELPPGTEALVPRYIDHLPADPFADGPLQLEGGEVFSDMDGKPGIVDYQPAELRWSVVPPTTPADDESQI